MLQYVLILNDTAMISVNLFGAALNIAYSLFYYAYCPNKVTETTFNIYVYMYINICAMYRNYVICNYLDKPSLLTLPLQKDRELKVIQYTS